MALEGGRGAPSILPSREKPWERGWISATKLISSNNKKGFIPNYLYHPLRNLIFSQSSIFSYFDRSLNARIESRKNWTPAQNERLDGVERHSLPLPHHLVYLRLLFPSRALKNKRGCEKSRKSISYFDNKKLKLKNDNSKIMHLSFPFPNKFYQFLDLSMLL